MITVRLTREAIEVGMLLSAVSSVDCGATSLFLGTVRDSNEGRTVTGIEYAAYETMAELELRRVVDEAVERFHVERVVVEHRVGLLGLGEVSVAIATAHAHRAPALDAGRYIIEQLKRRVPIWKREHYADGTREWVDPTRRAAPVSS